MTTSNLFLLLLGLVGALLGLTLIEGIWRAAWQLAH